MTLRRALVLPFLAASLAAFGLYVGLSSLLVSRAVENQMADRLARVASFFRESQVPVTPATLTYVEQAFGVEVERVDDPGPSHSAQREGEFLVLHDGPIVARMPAAHIAQERARALLPMLVLGAATLLLIGGLAWIVAARVAAPIERVAAEARRGGGPLEVPAGAPRELASLVTAFNSLMDQAVRAERLSVAGRLAAMLAHEIRNPLSAVRMAAQVLRARGADAEACRRIENETGRVEGAVAELLDLSRPAPLRRERIDLGPLLADVAALLRPRAEALGVTIGSPADAPAVMGDPERLKRAIWNLVLNAVQATPAEGRVLLSAERVDGHVRIRVADTGRGVPAEVRDRLFEPFVTSKPDGVGLGLAVARRAAQDHGGDVGFDSTPQGSTFWIEIPHGDDRGR